MLVLFAPIVTFLVSGASSLHVPFQVLLYSLLVFIVVPLTAGVLLVIVGVQLISLGLVAELLVSLAHRGGGQRRHAGSVVDED